MQPTKSLTFSRVFPKGRGMLYHPRFHGSGHWRIVRIASGPIQVMVVNTSILQPPLGLLDVAGLGLWCSGFLLESVTCRFEKETVFPAQLA